MTEDKFVVVVRPDGSKGRVPGRVGPIIAEALAKVTPRKTKKVKR